MMIRCLNKFFKSKMKRQLLYLFIILIFFLIYFDGFNFKKSDFEVFAVADRYEYNRDMGINKYKERKIEFVPISISKKMIVKKNVTSFPFPYWSDCWNDSQKIRNLIENRDKTAWYFIEHTFSEVNWYCNKINYCQGKQELKFTDIYNNDKLSDFLSARYKNLHFIGIIKDGEILLTNNGDIINLKEKERGRLHNPFLPENYSGYYLGISVVKKDLVFLQWADSETMENYIGIGTLRNGCENSFKVDFAPSHQSFIFSSPIGVNVSSDKIVFLAYKDRGEKNKFPNDLELCIFTLENQTINKVIDLPEGLDVLETRDTSVQPFLKWCPLTDSSLVIMENISYKGSIFEPADLFIIDTEKKEVKKKIKKSFISKSLRWSPDGKKIGFLSWDGELFVYDLEKDKLEKIVEDKEYFDFFWVNWKKNPMEMMVDKFKLYFK